MILKAGESGDYEEQKKNIEKSCKKIVKIIKKGWNVVITTGNGPQVGNILLQQEALKGKIPEMPLDVCGALSQGEIGYMVQQSLKNELEVNGIKRQVVSVITQVLVSETDAEFECPTKPIGPFYKSKDQKKQMVYQEGKGFRMVVPSPDPKGIVEFEVIKKLVEGGTIVIAAIGGGVPVRKKGLKLYGVEGVIDKDLASERLAEDLKMEYLMILTDVENVYLNFKKLNERKIGKISLKELKRYQKEGHFPKGSMGPKIEAAIRFLENGGKEVYITSPEKALECLEGKAGTIVTR